MERSTKHLANDAWEALLTAHSVIMKQLSTPDTWDDVSMREYDVLYTLSKCAAPMRLSELNERVLLSQPALSRMVDRLAARGLVSRVADPADRRGVRISLTEAGRAKQREVGGRHSVEVAQAVTSRLSQAEMDELERLCGKLAARGPGQPASGSPTDEAGRPTRRPAASPRNVKTTKDAS